MEYTIDNIDNIVAVDGVSTNEITTLQDMLAGLHSLYVAVKQFEEKLSNKKIVIAMGENPHFSENDIALITNCFHWFGISITNYARLIGYLDGIHKKIYTKSDIEDANKYSQIKKHVDFYVSSIPELDSVKKWRNKIAAHFAITDPRKSSDTASILAYSVMSRAYYSAHRFRVGVGDIQISHHDGGEDLNDHFPTWSVTEIFENLSPRYWPVSDTFESQNAPDHR